MDMFKTVRKLRRWINKSVQRRLFIWSICFWTLSILLVALVYLFIGQNQMLTAARIRNIQLASTISRDINAHLNDVVSDARTSIQHLEALEPDLYKQAETLLGLRLSSANYKAIYYFDMNGTLLIHLSETVQSLLSIKDIHVIVDRQAIEVGNEIKEVYEAAKSENIHISDVTYTPVEHIPVLYVGMPVSFAEGNTRIAVFEIDLTEIWQKIEMATIGQTGFTYVVSQEGIIIAHPESRYIGRRIQAEIEPVLASYEGSIQLTDPLTGKEIVAAYSPVGGLLRWGIVVSQDREEIYAAIFKSSTVINAILLTLGFIGTFGILLLIRSFTRPIMELTRTTQQIAQTGNLTKPAILSRSDEVGQLSQAFVQMIDKVKDSEGKLVGAADRIRESEQLFRSIVENSQAGIFTVDDSFRFTYANDRFFQILGYSGDEIIGHDFREFLDEESKKVIADRYIRRQKGRDVPSGYEITVIHRSGKLKNAELSAAVVRDANGKISTVGQVLDITDRKKDEAALRQSEEHYRTLFNSANDAIFIYDLEGNFLDANSVACDRLGYAHHELMQMNVSEIVAPEFAVLITERMAEIRSKGHIVLETAHLTKDGRVIPTEIGSRLIKHYGVSAILSIARDITERKKTQRDLQQAHDELEARVEQRTADLRQVNLLLSQEIMQRKETEEKLRKSETKYRDLVESANSIILEFDLKGNITFMNHFAQSFFGYREEEILGRNILGSIVPAFDSAGIDLTEKIADLFQHHGQYDNSENENMRSNGERVWVAWTNRLIYDESANLSHILCIGIDRTEQRKTAEALARQERENAAAEERTRLARDLHDAVSQTLFSASIIAEVLPRIWEKDQNAGRKRLEEIRELTRGALAEMRTLLFELRPVALADAELGELLHQLADSISGRSRISISAQIEGQCSLSAETKIGLYRIAQEALNNIAKHSGASQARIALLCQPDSVELCVTDNGRGFDLAKVPAKSLGLGIMHERANAIGASISIESVPARGTKVTVICQNMRGA